MPFIWFSFNAKKILKEATHIVLINSFNNFLPLSNKRNFILRSLKRMETKIIKDEPKDMLKEFIYRSFMPNHMNNSFKNIFYKSLESLNKTLLLSDLKELYINRDFPVFLRKDCKIIFIKSENDLILDNESNNNFLDSLNKTLERKPILIKLAQQGHCLNNLNLYEILLNTLKIEMDSKKWNEKIKNNFNDAAYRYLEHSNIQKFLQKDCSSYQRIKSPKKGEWIDLGSGPGLLADEIEKISSQKVSRIDFSKKMLLENKLSRKKFYGI